MKQDKLDKKNSRIAELLLPNEVDVQFLSSCNAKVPDKKGKPQTVTGDLYLTNLRLIHLGKVIGSKSLTTIELQSIVNLSTDAGAFISWLHIATPNTHASFQLAKQEAPSLLTLIQTKRLEASASPAQQSTQSDPLQQIEKLGNLLAQGLITQEEFDRKKTDLLGQI